MPDDITNIPSARSQFLTETGEVDRVWYRFLLNLFNLTGGGTSSTTLQDLQLGPEASDLSPVVQGLSDLSVAPVSVTSVIDGSGQLPIGPTFNDLTVLVSQINEFSLSPVPQPVLPASASVTSLIGTANQITVSAATGAVTLSQPASVILTSDITIGTGAIGKALVSKGDATYTGRTDYYNAAGTRTGSVGSVDGTTMYYDVLGGPTIHGFNQNVTVAKDITATNGNLISGTAGKGLQIKEGTNAKMGRVVLVGGTATVSTTAVASTSEIFLTNRITGGGIGSLSVGTVTGGTSFVINSTNILDTSTICWLIVDPA